MRPPPAGSAQMVRTSGRQLRTTCNSKRGGIWVQFGRGGNSFMAQGAKDVASNTTGSTGVAGVLGAGGSAASNQNSQSARNGGAGGDGIVIVTTFF